MGMPRESLSGHSSASDRHLHSCPARVPWLIELCWRVLFFGLKRPPKAEEYRRCRRAFSLNAREVGSVKVRGLPSH